MAKSYTVLHVASSNGYVLRCVSHKLSKNVLLLFYILQMILNTDTTNTDTTNTNTDGDTTGCNNPDIQVIMSQCNLELQEAVELYATHNGNVVSVISHQIDPFLKQKKGPVAKTELQKQFDSMRHIANQKDAMFTDFLNAQKQQTNTTNRLPTDTDTAVQQALTSNATLPGDTHLR
jgi:hypothetical protein